MEVIVVLGLFIVLTVAAIVLDARRNLEDPPRQIRTWGSRGLGGQLAGYRSDDGSPPPDPVEPRHHP
jgi:hypothetical protein